MVMHTLQRTQATIILHSGPVKLVKARWSWAELCYSNAALLGIFWDWKLRDFSGKQTNVIARHCCWRTHRQVTFNTDRRHTISFIGLAGTLIINEDPKVLSPFIAFSIDQPGLLPSKPTDFAFTFSGIKCTNSSTSRHS